MYIKKKKEIRIFLAQRENQALFQNTTSLRVRRDGCIDKHTPYTEYVSLKRYTFLASRRIDANCHDYTTTLPHLRKAQH